MAIRYIIRPSDIRTTPRLLKEALGAERTVAYPFQGTRRPSILKDFFLTYPPIEETEEYAQSLSNNSRRSTLAGVSRNGLRGESRSLESVASNISERSEQCLGNYSTIRSFFTKSKPGQRRELASIGFHVPFTIYGRERLGEISIPRNQQALFVKRPNRHRGGSGWSLLSTEENQEISRRPDSCTTSQGEYIQQILPKDYEYRIIICRGNLLITLLKRNTGGLSPLVPWNHQQGSSFVTVENIENNRLRRTDIYNKIQEATFLKHIDLCAIDVLYLKNPARYYVLELNFCPGLTIESNIQKVRNHVLQIS